MDDMKQALLDRIEADRDMLIEFYSKFVQAKTPNPPGDTREAVAHIRAFLDAHGLPYRIIDPHPEFPNVVGTFECGDPGRHLVLNGHIDVFRPGATRPGRTAARGAARSRTARCGGAAPPT